MTFLKRCACYAILISLAAVNAYADPINGYAINPRGVQRQPGINAYHYALANQFQSGDVYNQRCLHGSFQRRQSA